MHEEAQQMMKRNQENVENQDNKSDNSTLSIADFGLNLSIIPEDSVNQILQVELKKDCTIYFRGEVAYSNVLYTRLIKANTKIVQLILSIIAPMYYARPLSQFESDSDKIALLAIKRAGGGGKILIIDSTVYGKELYLSQNHLILTNIDDQVNGDCKVHDTLKHLSKRTLKQGFVMQKTSNNKEYDIDIHVLQADKNSNILQKYLGQKEQFYLPYTQNAILGVQGSVKTVVTEAILQKIVKFEGPGWIFFEPDSLRYQQRIGSLANIMALVMAFVVFFVLILQEL